MAALVVDYPRRGAAMNLADRLCVGGLSRISGVWLATNFLFGSCFGDRSAFGGGFGFNDDFDDV